MELCRQYGVGDKRIRAILNDGGLEIRNSHQKTVSTDDYIELNESRYPYRDGFKYIAVLKDNNSIQFSDYLNKSGALTAYIKNKFGIEIPSLYKRKKYFHEHGKQWYEQFFDIREVADERKEVKKCPYCSWETVDVDNKSGTFERHLLAEHSIGKLEYLKEHPDERKYFSLVKKTLDRQMETDEDKFVYCAICGEKFARLDWRHLLKHGITKDEYIKIYDSNTISKELHDRLSQNSIEMNKTLKPNFQSKPELEIMEFIKSFGIDCVHRDRSVLNGRELDIYVPSKKIAIEYNGNYWHTDKYIESTKHHDKMIACLNRGVRLVQIFEDEFVYRKEAVFNELKLLLGVFVEEQKGIETKYDVKFIDRNTAMSFLNHYSVFGFVPSTLYVGAFNGADLVTVMSFSKERASLDTWRLTRAAMNANYSCQGVCETMFNFFLQNNDCSEIKVFADRRWTIDEENNIYRELGFEFERYIKPQYTFFNQKVNRYARFNVASFRKKELSRKYGFSSEMTRDEMLKALGYCKIYDCGKIQYVWKKETKNRNEAQEQRILAEQGALRRVSEDL